MPVRNKNFQQEISKLTTHEMLLTLRTRFLPADLVLTPGSVILPATGRGRYRLTDAILIANGGAAAGSASINIVGIQGGVRVALITAAVAGLTQSAFLRMGAANAAVLADGKSALPNDLGTPIYIERVGGALTGATSIDIILNYALESGSIISGQ